MRADKRADIVSSQYRSKHLFEIIYIIGAGIIVWLNYLGFFPVFFREHEFSFTFLLFGLVCILSSNLLSFWWSFGWVLCPLYPRLSSKFLKISGLVFIGFALIVFGLRNNP